jgi:hypothetical protein
MKFISTAPTRCNPIDISIIKIASPICLQSYKRGWIWYRVDNIVVIVRIIRGKSGYALNRQLGTLSLRPSAAETKIPISKKDPRDYTVGYTDFCPKTLNISQTLNRPKKIYLLEGSRSGYIDWTTNY